MQLPQKLPLDLMQTRWASILNPFLRNPLNGMQIITGVSLGVGATAIDHLLGRMQQGWTILDVNGAATIYRSQPFNDKTLTLTSSAAVTVNIGVY